VVGSQDGVLSLWTYGDWGDYTDRYLGHPSSIDTICKLDEDTICTGSSDGIIRWVNGCRLVQAMKVVNQSYDSLGLYLYCQTNLKA
jgi:hypothetical protein